MLTERKCIVFANFLKMNMICNKKNGQTMSFNGVIKRD